MDENPFQPPRANLGVQDQQRGRPVIAVFVAFLAYFGFRITMHAGLTELLVFFIKTQNMDSAQVNLFMTEYKVAGIYEVVVYGIDVVAALLSGYVCAFIAHDNVAKPVGVLVLLLVFIATLAQMMNVKALLDFYFPFLYLIPMIILGAWLFVRFKKSLLIVPGNETDRLA